MIGLVIEGVVLLFGKVFGFGSRVRGRTVFGVVAVAVALGGGLAGSSAAHASTSTPEWQISYRTAVPSGSLALRGVAAINATNAWAVGAKGSGSSSRPTFLHWDGHSWSSYVNSNLGKIPSLAQFVPTGVEATAANNVWITGTDAAGNVEAVVYHGSNEWSSVTFPSSSAPDLIVVVSPTNVWGVRYEFCGSTGTQECFEHWNGHGWTESTAPGELLSVTTDGRYVYYLGLTKMKGVTTGNIGTPVIYKPSSTMEVLPGPALQITDTGASLVVETNGHKYIQGQLTYTGHPYRFWYFNGSSWSQMNVPSLGANGGMSSDGGNGFWNCSWHWTGAKLVNANNFSSAFYSAAEGWVLWADAPIPGTSEAWGVGEYTDSKNNPYDLIAAYPAIP